VPDLSAYFSAYFHILSMFAWDGVGVVTRHLLGLEDPKPLGRGASPLEDPNLSDMGPRNWRTPNPLDAGPTTGGPQTPLNR
jgi:hypothetical protein